MNVSKVGWLIVPAVAGLAVGWVARTATTDRERDLRTVDTDVRKRSSGSVPENRGPGLRAVNKAPLPVSQDTLETIKQVRPSERYERLMLWLLDASPEEIGAYWEWYVARDSPSDTITDMVMIGWTRIDPEGAIAAAEGTGHLDHAWWAWGCHEPGRALETALAQNPDHVGSVAWGIGEFRPGWLCENADRIPESARGQAYGGLVKWSELENPREVLDLLDEWGRTPPVEMMQTYLRQEPWEAVEWWKKHGDNGSVEREGLLYSTLATSNPEVLDQMIERQPSGGTKRAMREAAFQAVLEDDPDEAWEKAEAMPMSSIRGDRMAEVIEKVSRTDPDRAFGMAAELFADDGVILNQRQVVEYPNGAVLNGDTLSEDVKGMLGRFLSIDAPRFMDLAVRSEYRGDQRRSGWIQSSTLEHMTHFWAERDPGSALEWYERSDFPENADKVGAGLASALTDKERYGEALDVLPPGKTSERATVFRRWGYRDPSAAREWLDSSSLSQDDVDWFSRFLDTKQ